MNEKSKNMFISLLTAGSGLSANIGVGILVSRTLGSEGRGVIAQLVVYIAIVSAVSLVGISEAVLSKTTDSRDWGEMVSLSFISGLLFAVVAAPFAVLIALDESVSVSLVMVSILLPIRCAGTTCLFVVLATGKLYQHLFMSVSFPVFCFLLTCIGILSGKWNIVIACWVIVLSYILSSLIPIFLCRSLAFKVPSRKVASRTMRFGIRSWVGSALHTLNHRIGQLVLSFFGDASLLGIYANAASVASIPLAVQGGFASWFRLSFARKSRNAGNLFLFIVVLSSVLALVTGFLSYHLFIPVFGIEFEGGWTYACLLLLSTPLFSAVRLLAIKLAVNGMPGKGILPEILGLIATTGVIVMSYEFFNLYAIVFATLTSAVVTWVYYMRADGGYDV